MARALRLCLRKRTCSWKTLSTGYILDSAVRMAAEELSVAGRGWYGVPAGIVAFSSGVGVLGEFAFPFFEEFAGDGRRRRRSGW